MLLIYKKTGIAFNGSFIFTNFKFGDTQISVPKIELIDVQSSLYQPLLTIY